LGVIERKEREKEEMRRRIVDAAAQLFVNEGYEAASIRKIAAAIEYSPGAIYLYFKDKDDILYAIQEQGFEIFLATMERIAGPETHPFKRLQKLGEAYMEFAARHPELYDLMFTIRAPMRAHKDEWSRGASSFNFLRDTVRACMDGGYIRAANLDALALMIWSQIHGLVALHMRSRLAMFPEDARPGLIRESARLMLEFTGTPAAASSLRTPAGKPPKKSPRRGSAGAKSRSRELRNPPRRPKP
jgi:AcrR family transcriptional regulator